MKNKKIIWISLGIVLFLVVVVLGGTIINKMLEKKEFKYLSDNGYIELVDVGDYKLNIHKFGNYDNPKQKIVGISGIGENNFSIEMKYALDGLDNDNLFLFVDRAGYGYSDDTKEEQDIDRVVNDYRKALKNSQNVGPYVLMAHSFGGVIATYWESKYPEEISGVIFIDSTEVMKDCFDEEEYSSTFGDKISAMLNKTGLQRLFLNHSYYKLPENYSSDDQKVSDILNNYSPTTWAKISEVDLINKNTNKVFDNIVYNDIPKIYINATSGYTTGEEIKRSNEWLIERQKKIGLMVDDKVSDDEIEDMLNNYSQYRENIVHPYIELLGNTKEVLLPGNHMIFEERAEDLNFVLSQFLVNLKG